MIIPNTDVNLATEVRDVLNGAGGSVNNNIVSFFKSAAKINKWAYNKPIDTQGLYPQVLFNLSEQNRYEKDQGFDPRSFGSGVTIQNLFDMASSGNTWVYILPSGGEQSPYRLGDFRGYNTDAKPIINKNYIITAGQSTSNTYSNSFRFQFNDNAEIKITDLASLSTVVDMYYFIIARKSSGSSYKYIKSNYTKVGQEPSDGIYCNLTFTEPGQWECMLCVGQNMEDTDDSFIASRTDCLIMPDGYFTFTFTKITAFIDMTMVSPDKNNFQNQLQCNDYILSLGGEFFTFGMQCSESTVSVPYTVMHFGFSFYLCDENKNQSGGYAELLSESSYGELSYSGTDYTEGIVEFLPSHINLRDYFNDIDLNNATYLEIRPIANRQNDTQGFPRFATDHVWYVQLN